MEYVRIKLSNKVTGQIGALVNGEVNGYVGDILTVEEGAVELSADFPGAQIKEVTLEGTTAQEPMEVEIDVTDA